MHDADDQRESHLLRVGVAAELDVAGDHALLHPSRHPALVRKADSEESSHDESHGHGARAERDDQAPHLAESSVLALEGQAYEYEQQAVAHVAHTDGEEEQEEYAEEHRRVELVVDRHSVHRGKRLELAYEPVVLELDRRIVGCPCRLCLPVDVHVVEDRLEPVVVFRRGETLEDQQAVLCGALAGYPRQIEAEVGIELMDLPFERRDLGAALLQFRAVA